MERVQKALWVAVVGALVWMIAVSFRADGLRRYFRLKGDVQQLQVRNQQLRDENAELRLEIESMRSDRSAIEQAVREELGFVRPGELVMHVEEP